MKNTDKVFLSEIIENVDSVYAALKNELEEQKEKGENHGGVSKAEELKSKYTHPLDNDIIEQLKDIEDKLRIEDDDYRIYSYQEVIKKLWKILIQKSIICLRFFDSREPFQKEENKLPLAYGVDELADYFDKYTDFEDVLYGSAKYYRDHVIHVFRVWLLGIKILLNDNCHYLRRIEIEKGFTANVLEKLSIWTIISLTHDLGYPLEKALQMFDRTKSMMSCFVNNPSANIDIAFSGVQNSMNDFVLRFMSSKMWQYDLDSRKTLEEYNDQINAEMKRFVARLQPKYYFKFQKSLEHNKHGVISTLIIYKLLLYFLESDYSLNEDYMFDFEDARQFYIRREILRSIASHTCQDVYQMNICKFSFLLIICDDAQEWGRKAISELYVSKNKQYEFGTISVEFNENDDPYSCTIEDEHTIDTEYLKLLLKNFYNQSKVYQSIFRDGQDTINRDFEFKRLLTIKLGLGSTTHKYELSLEVLKDAATKITIQKTRKKIEEDDVLVKEFKEVLKEINKKTSSPVEPKLKDGVGEILL